MNFVFNPASIGLSAAHRFPLLADPAGYRACEWDLTDDPARRAYWVDLIADHFPTILAAGMAVETAAGMAPEEAEERARQAAAQFTEYIRAIRAEPARYGRLDIIQICAAREQTLRSAGFADPFQAVKERENRAALDLLPRLLRELDALEDTDRIGRLIEGVFTGNIFDLGATQTAQLFEGGRSVDFHEVRSRLHPRPWLIDGLDRWQERLARGPAYRRVILFVDNAGCDIVLGMIPFARDLLGRGGEVILTANTFPSLNDITFAELTALLAEIAEFDAPLRRALRGGQLRVVPSGNGLPLIDLTRISPELAAAASEAPVDLVVLEGMGRAVESNLSAALSCDALKIAMIKDPGVAAALGGEVYDLVMKYETCNR